MIPRPTRLSSSIVLATCLITGSVLHATPAHAQDDLERAKELFKRGEKLYQREDFKGAAEAFTEAYELSKRDELLYYMGKSWEAIGDLVIARRYYQLYLNNVPDADNAEKILDTVIELQRRINKEMGRVSLTSNIEESQVFVGDEKEPRCLTPCTIALAPDTEHTIHVMDPQGRKTSQVFMLSAGDKEEVTLSTEPRVTTGTLKITSDYPAALLSIDANTYALGDPVELETGTHRVTLRHDNASTWEGDVEVIASETTSLMVPMAHFGATQDRGGINMKRVGAYSLWSAGVGLLVGGALMGRQASATFDTLSARRQGGVDGSIVDQGRSQQRTANVLFITGGLALAGGGGLFAWDILSRDKGPSPSPSQDDSPERDDAPEREESTPRVDTLD
jgi:hypothetical protein